MSLSGRGLRRSWVSALAASLVACNSGRPRATSSGVPSASGSALTAGGITPPGATTAALPASASRGPGAAEPEPPGSRSPATAASTVRTGVPRIRTVFVILLENKVWSMMKGNDDAPYLNGTLIPRASIAEAYRAPHEGGLHPSEPNYVWLEAGDNLGITTDDEPSKTHRDTPDHLVTLLEKANVSWRAYQEDIAGDVCPLVRTGAYKPKHDPMVFFDDVTGTNDPGSRRCIEHVRPLTELERDLSNGKVARYNFITPNECHDMHTSCEPLHDVVRQGDDWLAEWMPKLFASRAYGDGGVIFITWDEAQVHVPECLFGDCPFGLIALSPLAKGGGYTNHIAYDHSSLLRTVQEIFGVTPLLRNAATATDLADLFTAFP